MHINGWLSIIRIFRTRKHNRLGRVQSLPRKDLGTIDRYTCSSCGWSNNPRILRHRMFRLSHRNSEDFCWLSPADICNICLFCYSLNYDICLFGCSSGCNKRGRNTTAPNLHGTCLGTSMRMYCNPPMRLREVSQSSKTPAPTTQLARASSAQKLLFLLITMVMLF